jgi:hypothetical protein
MAEQKKTNDEKGESNPEFGNFQRLLKQVVSVPKEKLAEHEREKVQKRTR